MQEISTTEASALLKQQPDETVLLDVREHVELQTAAIEGALHIPMQEIPQRLSELDKAHTILCMCHLGGRSAQVVLFLEAQGYSRVFNISGGIDDWALNINPEMPRY